MHALEGGYVSSANHAPAGHRRQPPQAAGRVHEIVTEILDGVDLYVRGQRPAPCINEDFAEICRMGSQPDVHIVVQRDRREGARRYVLPEGPVNGEPPPDCTLDHVRVNTDDPSEAVQFLLWGIEQAPSKHVAIIFSGLGISPCYVHQHLPPMEEAEDPQATETRVQRELFSICHDHTSRDALQVHELCDILAKVQEQLGRLIDLIGLNMGAAAFVEIAYELEGQADVLVASQRLLPDDGWPYGAIIREW